MLQAVGPSQVAALNDMLNAAVVNGTGRRAAIPHHPAAGKTGTTQDFRDAWFMGYTAHLAGGVWVGNDNGRPMNKVMGSGLPAEIWHDLMLAGHEGRAPLALPGTAPAQANPPAIAIVPAPASSQSAGRQPAVQSQHAVAQRVRQPRPPNLAPIMPQERIGEDFIARALEAEARVETPSLAMGGENVGAQQSPPVRRPPGMMSLGRWLWRDQGP